MLTVQYTITTYCLQVGSAQHNGWNEQHQVKIKELRKLSLNSFKLYLNSYWQHTAIVMINVSYELTLQAQVFLKTFTSPDELSGRELVLLSALKSYTKYFMGVFVNPWQRYQKLSATSLCFARLHFSSLSLCISHIFLLIPLLLLFFPLSLSTSFCSRSAPSC